MLLPCRRQPHWCSMHNPQGETNGEAQRAQHSSIRIPWIFQRKIRPSEAANGTASRILCLPSEILQMICEYLPLRSQASLAFTCTSLKQILGPKSWPQLKLQVNFGEKINFLELLQEDAPKSILCSQCHVLYTMQENSSTPALPRWPSTNQKFEFEPFYQLSRQQIQALVNQRACTHHLTCAGHRKLDLRKTEPSVSVQCRPRRVDDRFLLNRRYGIRLPPATHRSLLPSPVYATTTKGLRICGHVTLMGLFNSKPAFDLGSWFGYAVKGCAEPLYISERQTGYRFCQRCTRCITEFYLRDGDTVGSVVCDVYHMVMDGGHGDGQGMRKPYWLGDKLDLFGEELMQSRYGGRTIREIYGS